MIIPIRRFALDLGLEESTLPRAADYSKIKIPAELRDAVLAASNLAHDLWRSSRALPEGGFNPRLKPLDPQGEQQVSMLATIHDEYPNGQHPFIRVARHMTGSRFDNEQERLDIANLANRDLIPQFSEETVAGVLSAVHAILENPRAGMEAWASTVHDKWMERHRLLPPEQQNTSFLVPYSQLKTENNWDPKEEDRKFVRVAAWAIDKFRLSPVPMKELYANRPEFQLAA